MLKVLGMAVLRLIVYLVAALGLVHHYAAGKLLPPFLVGQASGCSRHVTFESAIPGATVVLVRSRNQHISEIGRTIARLSTGFIPIDPTETLIGGDSLTVYQYIGTDVSDKQAQSFEVQELDDQAQDAEPYVHLHLYVCSRGFPVSALRPGATVEAIANGNLLAQGNAPGGVAHLRTVHESGLANIGDVHTLRRRICLASPLPGGLTVKVIDSSLPAIEPLPLQPFDVGFELPAPVITAGNTACSRSITVEKVIPGAEVIIGDPNGRWWASSGPSDATTRTLKLPAITLKEGDPIEVRQELGCRTRSQRGSAVVGPYAQLKKLTLQTIWCPTQSTIHIGAELPIEGADLEFEVTYEGGVTEIYRTIVEKPSGPHSAPKMAFGALVRVRQGQCETWSEWSDPAMIKHYSSMITSTGELMELTAPRIVGDLFHCQHKIAVETSFILEGQMIVRSNVIGEIGRSNIINSRTIIEVAPSLLRDHEITVEHHYCDMVKVSERKIVIPPRRQERGEFDPMFDGDITVILRGISAGVYVEIWNQQRRLGSGETGFSESGKVNVAFNLDAALVAGDFVYAIQRYCDYSGRVAGKTVIYRAPILTMIKPDSALVGSTVFTLHGQHFRPGAKVVFANSFVNTEFKSASELRVSVHSYLVDTPKVAKVWIVNPDGQLSNARDVQIHSPPQPHPTQPTSPTTPSPTSQIGYSKVHLYNCVMGYRLLSIWMRDATTGSAWQFVSTLAHHFDFGLACPKYGAPALEVALPDGHLIEIKAFDSADTECPADPNNLNSGCWLGTFPVRGKAAGGILSWTFS